MSSMFRGNLLRPRTLLLVLLALAVSSTVAIASGVRSDQASGGEITIGYLAQPDFLDPALSYSFEGFESLANVYMGLLTYPYHARGAAQTVLIPGLAQALPTVSKDGKTYTLTLRRGLRYSNGAAVKASDFEHSLKRALALESGGASFYETIVGAKAYLKANKPAADVAGITANNATGKITIRIEARDASFANLIALPFAYLVPGNTPFRNMTKSPPPGVGPYKITRSVPNREFVLEKNAEFAKLGLRGIPLGNVDKITVKIVQSPTKLTQDILDNKLDYGLTPTGLPADLRGIVLQRAASRRTVNRSPNTHYIFLNHRVAPFDDPLVRQAVNYGLDRPAIARLFGGQLIPGCALIHPAFAGYDRGFDTNGCPYGDVSKPPNIARARALVKQAGAEGAAVTVYASTTPPRDRVALAYAQMLKAIGLDATPKIIDASVFNQTVGNQDTKAQTGVARWGADFPHPLGIFFLVDGNTIQPTNNFNWGNVNDPRINSEIKRLRSEPNLQQVANRWRALDRYLISPPHAHVAVFGHGTQESLFSNRIDVKRAVFHQLYVYRYTSFALKK